MSNRIKYHLIDILARLCAAIPPFAATIYFYPVWIRQSSGATLSGTVVAAFLVCMIPFWKKIFDAAKSFSLTTASMPILWLVLFGVFFALREIVNQMIYISIWGLIGAFLSVFVCLWRNKYRDESIKPMKNKEDDYDQENEEEGSV